MPEAEAINSINGVHLLRQLYVDAIALLSARRRVEPGENWLWKIMSRNKPKQAAIALANRMAPDDTAQIDTRSRISCRVTSCDALFRMTSPRFRTQNSSANP